MESLDQLIVDRLYEKISRMQIELDTAKELLKYQRSVIDINKHYLKEAMLRVSEMKEKLNANLSV